MKKIFVVPVFILGCFFIPSGTLENGSFTIWGRVIMRDYHGPVRVMLNHVFGDDVSPQCTPIWTTVSANGDFLLKTSMIQFRQGPRNLKFELVFFRQGRAPFFLHVEPYSITGSNTVIIIKPLFLSIFPHGAVTQKDKELMKKETAKFKKEILPQKLSEIMLYPKEFPTSENCGTPGCSWVKLARKDKNYTWYGCIDQDRIVKPGFDAAMKKAAALLKPSSKKKLSGMIRENPYDKTIHGPLDNALGGGLWWVIKR
ncbi:MAG: hypothetical protein GY754_22070 [bacterium]|nr:hypothetical protein [bacterium]